MKRMLCLVFCVAVVVAACKHEDNESRSRRVDSGQDGDVLLDGGSSDTSDLPDRGTLGYDQQPELPPDMPETDTPEADATVEDTPLVDTPLSDQIEDMGPVELCDVIRDYVEACGGAASDCDQAIATDCDALVAMVNEDFADAAAACILAADASLGECFYTATMSSSSRTSRQASTWTTTLGWSSGTVTWRASASLKRRSVAAYSSRSSMVRITPMSARTARGTRSCCGLSRLTESE